MTLSRAPLRRPVCPIPKGSHSSHRPNVCLHPCVQLGDPESCSPRQDDLSTNHEHGTLAADLCSRSPCSSTLLPGVVSSTRQVTDPACYWIAHSQAACYGTEIALLATGFVVQCATGVKKRVSSSVLLVSLSETVSSFQRMLHVSPLLLHSSNSCPQSDADARNPHVQNLSCNLSRAIAL